MVIVIFHEKNFCISNFMAEELASFSTFITCNNSRAKKVSEGSKLEVHLIVSNVSDGWAYFEYNSHSLTQEASFKETQITESTFRHALVIPSRTWVFQDISFVMHGHLGDFPLSIPIILGSVTSWVTFQSTLTNCPSEVLLLFNGTENKRWTAALLYIAASTWFGSYVMSLEQNGLQGFSHPFQSSSEPLTYKMWLLVTV